MEKLLVVRDALAPGTPSTNVSIWEAVKNDNIQEVYHLIAISDVNIIHTIFDGVFDVDVHPHIDAQQSNYCHTTERNQHDPTTCEIINDSNKQTSCLQGCSLLHLACHHGNPVMLELLLQFGADINLQDFHGRTPLHHCISNRKNPLAKFLLRR